MEHVASLEGPGFESTFWPLPFCVGVAYSFQVLELPHTVHRHAVSVSKLISDSKSPVGVNGSVNGCLSLYKPCDRLAT